MTEVVEVNETEVKGNARPNRRRALWIALAVAFAPAAAAAAVVTVLVTHSIATTGDVTPVAAPYGELDHMIADAEVEQSQRDQQTIPMPTLSTERVTIPNHTSLPGIVALTGDDLCHLAGGIVLQSKPSQCSVDLPNVLGTSR